MTSKELEKKWHDWNTEEYGQEPEQTLQEFIAGGGEAWCIDYFLCQNTQMKNYYYVRNASNTEYDYEIVAGRRSPKNYDVTFDSMDLEKSTTVSQIADFINRNELKEL